MGKILITDGLGFIFSHVTEYFASKDCEVFVIDNLSDGSHPELLEKWANLPIFFHKSDINDICDWDLRTTKFDYIIHAAAESNVDKSIKDQKAFLHSNILGTYALLEFVRQFQPDLKQFLYINTDEVYGSSEEYKDPFQNPTMPSNPYSASKASGGAFCWAYQNTYGLPIQEVRMCNIVGQRQATTKLVPRIIDCIENDRPIPVYDGGAQTREYMDVRDVSPLIEAVLQDGRGNIHNLTFNQELTTLEVIQTVADILGKQPKIEHATRPGHDQRYRMMPSSIIFNEVGQHRFQSKTLQQTIEWSLESLTCSPCKSAELA